MSLLLQSADAQDQKKHITNPVHLKNKAQLSTRTSPYPTCIVNITIHTKLVITHPINKSNPNYVFCIIFMTKTIINFPKLSVHKVLQARYHIAETCESVTLTTEEDSPRPREENPQSCGCRLSACSDNTSGRPSSHRAAADVKCGHIDEGTDR